MPMAWSTPQAAPHETRLLRRKLRPGTNPRMVGALAARVDRMSDRAAHRVCRARCRIQNASDVTGFDTLAELGFAMLPETPMAHTASGGLHLYFEPPDRIEIRNTAGAYGAGIGPQLDWRGEGGSIILPSPDSGYVWDPHWHFETTILAPVPAVLLPRAADRALSLQRKRPASGLSPYAEAALDNACRRIIAAPSGEQEITVNREAFAIGTLAGAGAIPLDFARKVLVWAARQISNYDSRRPWRATEIDRKIERAFSDGLRRAPGAFRA